MFHEIDQDRIDRVRGMDITVVTTATNDDEGRALLKALGFPSRELTVAKTALKNKAAKAPKFKVRGYTRCQRCGRPHAVYKFGLCRICLRRWPTAAARRDQVLLVKVTHPQVTAYRQIQIHIAGSARETAVREAEPSP